MSVGSCLACLILACTTPAEEREWVLGDLDEEYTVQCHRTSRLSARCWYWSQILRSLPWLVWRPVHRSGWLKTIGVALAAAAAQALVELMIAHVVPRSIQQGAPGAELVTMVGVLTSLMLASWIASRVRPGAGAMLTAVVAFALLARTARSEVAVLQFGRIVQDLSAPCATLVGTVLAINVRPLRRTG